MGKNLTAKAAKKSLDTKDTKDTKESIIRTKAQRAKRGIQGTPPKDPFAFRLSTSAFRRSRLGSWAGLI